MNYGHWKTLKEVDVNDFIAFTYVIEFSNGTKYIGAKKMWKNIKTPPSSFKRRKDFIESDWKTYTSSSNEVNESISKGIHPSNYIIIGFYKTWGTALFAEAMLQIHNNVLADYTWLNKHIEGHFTSSCLDPNIEFDIDNWKKYQEGKLKPKSYDVSETLYDTLSEKDIVVNNIYTFCVKNSLNHSTMTRLLNGDIDILDRWMLPKSLQRQKFEYSYNGSSFERAKDVIDKLSIDRKQFNALVKNGDIIKMKVESKLDYKKRLSLRGK